MFDRRAEVLWVLAGMLIHSTLAAQTPPAGTPRAAAPKDLLAGAGFRYSTDGGQTWSPDAPTVQADQTLTVLARADFHARRPEGRDYLELRVQMDARCRAVWRINDRDVKGPLDGMNYRAIPAIDADVLRDGANVLTAEIQAKNPSPRKGEPKPYAAAVMAALKVLTQADLAIQTGPALGAFGQDFFSVTCRTNIPTKVSVEHVQFIGGSHNEKRVTQLAESPTGLFHRLLVKDPPTTIGAHAAFLMRAQAGDYSVSAPFAPPRPPPAGTLRFVAMGDCRTNPADWAKVAAAAGRTKADLVVFTGDLVASGRNEWEWDEQFFGPSAGLFSDTPIHPVVGNHDANAPIIDQLFWTPSSDGKARNWAQAIGPALLIGVDGTQDWAEGGQNAGWLEKTLEEHRAAKFVFLASHYPPWSSSNHGALADDGLPKEREVREARQTIMPILARHKATAYLAGHDHCYERSEPPDGVTIVITGGAGAPRYVKAKDADKQNPHSKAYASELHYCLIEIDGGSCALKAVTPEGKVLDTRTWKSR